MDNNPGGWACHNWYWHIPLPKQWHETSDDYRERVLAFWIRASESDEWTFSQLQTLLADLMDSGEPIPTALQQWANEVAAARRGPPTRKGPKSDPFRDSRTLMVEIFSCMWFGWSKRRAHREIGKITNRSPEAVASATARARRQPPGA